MWSDCLSSTENTSPVPYQWMQTEKSTLASFLCPLSPVHMNWNVSLQQRTIVLGFFSPAKLNNSISAIDWCMFKGILWCWLKWLICVQYDCLIIFSEWSYRVCYFLFHETSENHTSFFVMQSSDHLPGQTE